MSLLRVFNCTLHLLSLAYYVIIIAHCSAINYNLFTAIRFENAPNNTTISQQHNNLAANSVSIENSFLFFYPSSSGSCERIRWATWLKLMIKIGNKHNGWAEKKGNFAIGLRHGIESLLKTQVFSSICLSVMTIIAIGHFWLWCVFFFITLAFCFHDKMIICNECKKRKTEEDSWLILF